MEDRLEDPQTTDKLWLDKYGLSYLKGRNILALTSSDIDKYLSAVGDEDRFVNVPIPFTPPSVERLLSQSECRRCGKCCIPNPLNPEHPGVEVFEEELKSIAKHLHSSYKYLRKKTVKGKKLSHPNYPDRNATTRWLSLPCPFYNMKAKECQVYDVRPFVCKIYPITLDEGEWNISIKVNCDYGKDLVKSAVQYLKAKKPDLLLLI